MSARVVVMGPQGSGKGTQAALLALLFVVREATNLSTARAEAAKGSRSMRWIVDDIEFPVPRKIAHGCNRLRRL